MSLDDDSMFEQALRSDLPSADEQARFRQRLLLAGLSVGGGLAASSAASAQASFGATLAAKVAALSWPATMALGVAVATPLLAVPVWLTSDRAVPAPSSAPANAARAAAVAPTQRAPAPSVQSAVAASAEAASVASAPPSPTTSPLLEAKAIESAPRALARPASSNGVIAAAQKDAPPSSALSSAAFAVPSARASTLAAETELLDRAFAEIAAGHRASAAALIAEHERRFPNGVLSTERERARARLAQSAPGE